MVRRRIPRKEKQTILIFTEGKKTEPSYFSILKRLLPKKSEVDFKCVGIGKDPLRLVEKCVKAKKDNGKAYSSYVCLVDVDDHKQLDKALKLAKSHKIKVVVSNLKFEVWLLWHFLGNDGGLFSAKSSKELDAIVEKFGFSKNKEVKQFNLSDVQRAYDRAKKQWADARFNRVGKNPSTSMHLILDLLKFC